MTTYTVALGDAPHSLLLKKGTIGVPEAHLTFPGIKPIPAAFAPMVRTLTYDFSEMAIATYLQAREAGKRLTLLPIVLNGDFHHHSIVRWPGGKELGPRDLIGQRVGVRAYTQTTGLWVHGVLKEEFGVESGQLTWVTTEGPHVAEYAERAEAAWFERHQTVPVNHMLTVKTEILENDPAAVKGVYRAFTEAIDQARAASGVTAARQRAITYGMTAPLVTSMEVAIRYGREQDLLRQPVTADEIFADFQELPRLPWSVARTRRSAETCGADAPWLTNPSQASTARRPPAPRWRDCSPTRASGGSTRFPGRASSRSSTRSPPIRVPP
jgi:4,5-dihydroxyphthalate decarboxylase